MAAQTAGVPAAVSLLGATMTSISDDDEHDGEQADTAAYWHPPQRDDVGKATATEQQTTGEYSVSASSVHAEDERVGADRPA